MTVRSAIHVGLAAALVSCATPPYPADGFADFLPAPLDANWERSRPKSGRADELAFGGGLSTSATYRDRQDGCRLKITITGDAPMMQGLSMNFSNPAAAGLTGAIVEYLDDEPLVITADGEIQTLTRNYLTQYTGSCDKAAKLAYVAATDRSALRDFQLAPTERRAVQTDDTQGSVVWERAYGGPAKDWAYAMTGTHDGGLCTAGRTASKGAGLEDLWLVRLDGDGNRLWDRTFGGQAIDRGRAIIESSDRGLVVAGATESSGAGEFDAWILKLDAAGELLWERVLGGTATDWASAVVETNDGGFAVGAYTQDTAGAPYDFWVIKLDRYGNTLWQRRYGGARTDWVNAIAETPDGALVVVGHTESKGAGKSDLWVLKLAADGEPLWDKTFGGADADYASTVSTAANGDVLVGGMTRSAGAGGFDIRVLRLSAGGDIIWDQTLGGAKDDWIRAVTETRDGNLALAGYTMSKGAGLYDMWALQLDAAGNRRWEQTVGQAGNEWARALVELPNGDLALAGDTLSRGAGASDALVVRLSPPR